MERIEIYTKAWCPYCARAKRLLEISGLSYREIDVTTDRVRRIEMVRRSGKTTVPQVFIDQQPIGGHDALMALAGNGRLTLA